MLPAMLCAQIGRHLSQCWPLLLLGLLFLLACCPQSAQFGWAALAAGGSGGGGLGLSRPVWRGKQLVGAPAQARLKRALRSPAGLSASKTMLQAPGGIFSNIYRSPPASTAKPAETTATTATTTTAGPAAAETTTSRVATTTTAAARDNEIAKKSPLKKAKLSPAKQQQVQAQLDQLRHQNKQRAQSNAANANIVGGQELESTTTTSNAGEESTRVRNKQQRLVSFGECEYEKGAWEGCQSNGLQQRTLRLTRKSQLLAAKTSGSAGQACEPNKIMRRECRLGCKYVRGEWSATCTDGVRVRIDTLVGTLPPTGGQQDGSGRSQQQQQHSCQPQRKVSKDCGRTCHYVKSAWSECANGFKTRNLTIEASSPPSANCAKEKQVKRECRSSSNNKQLAAPKLARPQRKRQRQQSVATTTSSTGCQPGAEAPTLAASTPSTAKRAAGVPKINIKRRKR